MKINLMILILMLGTKSTKMQGLMAMCSLFFCHPEVVATLDQRNSSWLLIRKDESSFEKALLEPRVGKSVVEDVLSDQPSIKVKTQVVSSLLICEEKKE